MNGHSRRLGARKNDLEASVAAAEDFAAADIEDAGNYGVETGP